MHFTEHELYKEDIKNVSSTDLPWEKLQGASILISGASGLLGGFLIDVLMWKNGHDALNCKIYAIGRNKEKLEERFQSHKRDDLLRFLIMDINEDEIPDIPAVDYVFHAASNTHPVLYSTQPIQTIMTNLLGTKKMLDYAAEHGCKRFAFASSNEIYGENRGDVELFDESYCGYIDCNTLRAGYTESKRCGEALCQAYRKEKGLDVVIPRFTRSYGPGLQETDTKALSQFLRNGLRGENIVLKSEGTQYYSYTYVADAISGFLTILLKGEDGEAFNIADEKSDIQLRDLAAIIAKLSDTEVVFDLPDATEAAGFSKATKARLNGRKLRDLGWEPNFSIEEGIEKTIMLAR